MAWAMIRKQLVCVMSVYGPQTGRTEAEKQEFRDALEMMIGMVELETLLCIAGDFNAHIGETEPGEQENVGKFGWGTRNREGQASSGRAHSKTWLSIRRLFLPETGEP